MPETKERRPENDRHAKEKNESVFGSLCDKCSEQTENGIIGSFMTSYSDKKEKFDSSVIAAAVRHATHGRGIVRRAKRLIARCFEKSIFMNLAEQLKTKALGCPAKTYGAFFATFGIYASLIFLIKKYALFATAASFRDLFCGIALIILALPLLFSTKTLSAALGSSVLIRALLSDVRGASAAGRRTRTAVSGAVRSWAIIAGIAAGMLTYFIPPYIFLLALFLVVLISLLLAYPESGVSLALLTAPFLSITGHPSAILAAVTLLSAVGYTIKLLRGKRTMVFGPAEAAVTAFLLLTLAGGLFIPGGGDPTEAILRASMMLVYFLAVNTVKSRQRLATCIRLVLISATLISFTGIAQYMLGKATYDWLDSSLFADIAGRSTSVFSNPNTLAYFIITVFPLSLAAFVLGSDARSRFIAGFSALSLLLCTVVTWSRGAWIGLAVSAFMFMLMMTPRAIAVVPAATTAVSLACILLPNTLGARIDSITSLADSANYYRVRIWNGVCRIIGRYSGGGIGIGEDVFTQVYVRVAAPEVWHASHAHSLWLQTLTELGIAGLIVFLTALVFIWQKSAECVRLSTDKKLSVMCGGCICGVIALTISGFFDFVWYNNTVLFMFWAVAGLASAAADIRLQEIKRSAAERSAAESNEKAADVTVLLGRE